MNIEKYYDPVTKVIAMPNETLNLNPKGIGHLIYNSLSNNLELTSQIEANTGATESNSEFLQKCIRTSIKMQEFGITSNDIITICSYNHLNSSVPYIASIFLGTKTSALDPSMSVEEIVFLLNIVKPTFIFVSEVSEILICTAIEKLGLDIKVVVFGETRNNIRFTEFLQSSEQEESFTPYIPEDLDETALIVFSSGTTGLPKGICLGHRFVMSIMELSLFLVPMVYSTLYWTSNCYSTLISIYKGFPRIICKTMDPQLVWTHVKKYNVKSLFLPSWDAIQCFKNIPVDYKCPLKSFLIGGSNINIDYLKKYRKAFPSTAIKYIYGQTELFLVLNPVQDENKIGTVGCPMPHRTYKVVDIDTGEALGFNQRGELRVKSKLCMNGYYNKDSSDIWDEEGFLKTGDICYYDESFCFYIVDRTKEIFKYKTHHITPAKLEGVLQNHPSIALAAVVGIPHPEEDNHILAVVQVTEGHKLTEEEVIEFVDGQVEDKNKLRAGVKFINNIPLTPTGKVKRRELRDMVINGEL